MLPRVDAPWNDGVLNGLQRWAADNAAVRAMLLTNSRAGRPGAADALSDFDIVLAVHDIHRFFADRAWIGDFGTVLVTYWDPIYKDAATGLDIFGNVVQYETGLRIDFTLWPLEQLRQIVAQERLPADLDLGYAVLVDKDGLTTGLRAPGRTAFAPQRPDAAEFARFVEEFYSDAPFVAKCLLRAELLPAKWALDHDMKQVYLRRLLEWQVALQTGWTVQTGSLGRGLKPWMSRELWLSLESGYAAAGIEDNWRALEATLELFREVGEDVADGLGYAYPVELHRRVCAFLQRYRREGAAALAEAS